MCECDGGYSEQRTTEESLSSKARTTRSENFLELIENLLELMENFSLNFSMRFPLDSPKKINPSLELAKFNMDTRSLLRIFFQN